MSKNLYQDRSAWRTLFVNWQEFIFLPGDWLERERGTGEHIGTGEHGIGNGEHRNRLK